MDRERSARCMRTAGCAALVALLAACSYLGARQPQVSAVSVPVAVEVISERALGAASLEQTQEKLRQEREKLFCHVAKPPYSLQQSYSARRKRPNP